MNSIPIIDISCLDKKTLALEWDNAFRTFGCCILIGHGIVTEEEIADNLFTEVKDEVLSFFAQPLETKMQFNLGPYGNDYGGYTPRSGEAVSQSNNQSEKQHKQISVTSDPVESFVLKPQTYQQHANILPQSSVYYEKCETLVYCLHALSTRALGISEEEEEDYFRKYYSATDKNAQGVGLPSFALRLAHYPPQVTQAPVGKDGTGCKEPETRYGAHTDYMGFTVLRPDESDWSTDLEGSGGLEVFDRIKECWTPVILSENIRKTALIINAGDLLQRWTNDRWVSPLHRVAGPQPCSPAAQRSRTALVFFSGPMADALITVCPAACVTSTTTGEERGRDGENQTSSFLSTSTTGKLIVEQGQGSTHSPVKYAPVVAQDYLMSKINPTALSIASGTSSS